MKKYLEKKESIKNAGRELFVTYGFQKTTLEDIAAKIGLRKNSLYYYFPDKETLFKELIEDEVNYHFERLRKIVASHKSSKTKILSIIKELTNFVHERGNKYSITMKAFLEINQIVENDFPEFKYQVSEIINNILKEGINNKEFKKHNTKQVADDIVFLVRSIELNYFYNSRVQFVYELDFDMLYKTMTRITNYIFNGLQ